jgi:hypothetical protein
MSGGEKYILADPIRFSKNEVSMNEVSMNEVSMNSAFGTSSSSFA